MLPIIGAEMLVQDRRRDVAAAAAHDQLVRACRAAHPRPGRGRLGWLLMRAGVRLAHGDVIGAPLDVVVR